jgi:hypothetical protein
MVLRVQDRLPQTAGVRRERTSWTDPSLRCASTPPNRMELSCVTSACGKTSAYALAVTPALPDLRQHAAAALSLVHDLQS